MSSQAVTWTIKEKLTCFALGLISKGRVCSPLLPPCEICNKCKYWMLHGVTRNFHQREKLKFFTVHPSVYYWPVSCHHLGWKEALSPSTRHDPIRPEKLEYRERLAGLWAGQGPLAATCAPNPSSITFPAPACVTGTQWSQPAPGETQPWEIETDLWKVQFMLISFRIRCTGRISTTSELYKNFPGTFFF